MKISDINIERENRELINQLGQLMSSEDKQERLAAALNGKIDIMKNNDAGLLSVRVSRDLISRIDDAAREIAYREKRRVTRSTLVADWLAESLRQYEQERLQEQEP